ncbi:MULTISPECIES: BPSL0761 family protein [unclassified Roseateles]|uniref:BPSL0761 family protein n=1 Tax=unclassified Roseateles TaxID=2626991 RepID=UPI0009EA18A1|nr:MULTISPECIES: BPSL0761 family protein [unclassified Roseateles]
MTTPDERTRALLQTREFLLQLVASDQIPSVSEEVRRQARHLLRHYPGPMELNWAHRALPMHFGEVWPSQLSGPNEV